MVKKAHVENGAVINISVVTALSDGDIDGTGAAIGDLYIDGAFVRPPAPPPPIPQSVSMRQARLALLGAGLLDAVDAAIAGMTGTEGRAAQIEWEYASEVVRTSALVAGMGAALGMTDEQLDDLFLQASTL